MFWGSFRVDELLILPKFKTGCENIPSKVQLTNVGTTSLHFQRLIHGLGSSFEHIHRYQVFRQTQHVTKELSIDGYAGLQLRWYGDFKSGSARGTQFCHGASAKTYYEHRARRAKVRHEICILESNRYQYRIQKWHKYIPGKSASFKKEYTVGIFNKKKHHYTITTILITTNQAFR